jgi:hypothetical protein
VGFAAVGTHSRVSATFSGHSIIHFFIARRYRRHGYGRASRALRSSSSSPAPGRSPPIAPTSPQSPSGGALSMDIHLGATARTWANTQQWRGSIQLFSAQKEEEPVPTPRRIAADIVILEERYTMAMRSLCPALPGSASRPATGARIARALFVSTSSYGGDVSRPYILRYNNLLHLQTRN